MKNIHIHGEILQKEVGLEYGQKHLKVWEDRCISKIEKWKFFGKFHQNNGGVDLESDCDGLEAKFEKPFNYKEHLEVGFPTSLILLREMQLAGSYGRFTTTTYC